MKKEDWVDIVTSIFGWCIGFLIVQWLVDGSFWLNAYLASAITGLSLAAIKTRRLKDELSTLRSAYLITDEQLVKVSAQVDDYEQRIYDLEKTIKEFEHFRSD